MTKNNPRRLSRKRRTKKQLMKSRIRSSANPTHTTVGNRIFLVHGHDEVALLETARFLEKLGQEPIILREQSDRGLTIIEKFESYADVTYAVVLLTQDDHGGISTATSVEQNPRPRQNVIFELGFFIGRLGRNRVCALYRPGVEIPSNYVGVLYQEYDDNGGWCLKLARELNAAGLSVNLNNVL